MPKVQRRLFNLVYKIMSVSKEKGDNVAAEIAGKYLSLLRKQPLLTKSVTRLVSDKGVFYNIKDGLPCEMMNEFRNV